MPGGFGQIQRDLPVKVELRVRGDRVCDIWLGSVVQSGKSGRGVGVERNALPSQDQATWATTHASSPTCLMPRVDEGGMADWTG